ncbi:hypothetical protein GR268_46390, partial [Rhizobium leguminosarum]|nr:hypothetical protein [Rhizobium leguminosarum]
EIIGTYYSAMAYDAVKLEVHDFASLVTAVANFSRILAPTTQLVSSNVVNLNNDTRFVELGGGSQVQPYAIIDADGSGAPNARVAFVGTMAVGVNDMFGSPGLINSTVELTALRSVVAQLQNQGINKIVASVSGPNVVDAILEEVPG